jgi:NADH-quinone oxidoreductase subunit M
VYPKPALDVINPAVTHTLTTIDQPDPAPRMAEGPVRWTSPHPTSSTA